MELYKGVHEIWETERYCTGTPLPAIVVTTPEVALIMRIRLLLVSAIHTFPNPSNEMPLGDEKAAFSNAPSAQVLVDPAHVTTAPATEPLKNIFRNTLFILSETMALPNESNAIDWGVLKVASAEMFEFTKEATPEPATVFKYMGMVHVVEAALDVKNEGQGLGADTPAPAQK